MVQDGCLNDALSLVSSTFDPSYVYYINENTDGTFSQSLPGPAPQQKVYTAEWANTVQGCPIDFKLEILDSGTGSYRDLTATE